MKIKDIKNEIPELTLDCFVKTKQTKETKNNNPYYLLTLQDKTGEIDAKIWNVDKNIDAQQIDTGQVLRVTGNASKFNDVISITIKQFKILKDADISDYVTEAPLSEHEMQLKLFDYVTSIENPLLQDLVKTSISEKNPKFFTQPAATSMHHDFKGGLSYHTLCMLDLAEGCMKVYKQLNRDLIVSGIIMHDIGKTDEITDFIKGDKTFSGQMLGHINIANDLITRYQIKNDIPESNKTIIELKHIVLSHHGELEYGSNITPKTPEAQIVHYIDQIDAKMMMFEKAFNGIEEDTFTKRIYPLHNSQVYKRGALDE